MSQAQVQTLTQRLSADPYRADLLVERLLVRAAQQDFAGARADLAALRGLGAVHPFSPALARLVAGELRIIEDERVFLLFDPELEPSWVGWSAHFLKEARAAAQSFFGPLERVLIVELSKHRCVFQCSSSHVPGIAYIKLAARASLAEHQAIVAHELAHVYLSSGNRFVDEGLAAYFQARMHQGRILVESERVTAADLEAMRDEVLPLRALLAYDARMDVAFDRLVLFAQDKLLVYAACYIFVAHLFNVLAMGGVKALCATLRACPSPAAHPALIESVLAAGVEGLDRALYRKVATEYTSLVGLVGGLAPSANVLWSEFSPHDLRALIQVLREALAKDASSVGVKAVLARALIRRMLDMRPGHCAAELAEARSLVHDLMVDFHFPERDRLLLEGWLAIAQTHAATSTPLRVISWEKALGAFRRALERFGEDPEVLCASAILHWRGPEEHGANRALARRCLASVRQMEGWAALADAIQRAHDPEGSARSPPPPS